MVSLIFILQLLLMPLTWANTDYVLDSESTLCAYEAEGDFSLALGRHNKDSQAPLIFSFDDDVYFLRLHFLAESHQIVKTSFSLLRPILTYGSVLYLHQNLYIPPPHFTT